MNLPHELARRLREVPALSRSWTFYSAGAPLSAATHSSGWMSGLALLAGNKARNM